MHVYEHGVGVHVYDQEGNERAGITATESGGSLGVLDENQDSLVLINSKQVMGMAQDSSDNGMVHVFGTGMSGRCAPKRQ